MSEPTLDQKIAWANLQAARLAKEADEKYRESHPDRVAFFVKEPGQGRHMRVIGGPNAEEASALVEEVSAWLDRSFGPYPARHKATLAPAQAAAYRRLWNAIKETP